MTQQNDARLVENTLRGDRESYGFLVDRYKNGVYRYALRMLADCDAAEDVVQEAFLKGYVHLDRLRNRDAFASWIMAIVRNLCQNVYRSRKKQPVSLDHLAELGNELPEAQPDDEVDEKLLKNIRKHILLLPENYREVLELFYCEEYKTKEIAALLGTSLSAVVTRLHRGRKKLLSALEKEGVR